MVNPMIKVVQDRLARDFGKTKPVQVHCQKDQVGYVWPPLGTTVMLRLEFTVEELRTAGVEVQVINEGRVITDSEYAAMLVSARKRHEAMQADSHVED
jgi:hypothetical protein